MKKWCIAIAGALVLAAGAAELRPLPWSEGMCVPKRFVANSSGKMKISAEEGAVRFDVEFKPGTDFWAYPFLRFQGPETLAGVEVIRFEFKAIVPEGCRSAYVMFGGRKPYLPMPAPNGEYQTVTIEVDKVTEPATVKELRIGLNPRAPQVTFFIRNLEFLSSKKSGAKYDAADAVTVAAPGSVFLQGEALKFQLKPYAAPPAKWLLRNWQGETLREGEWPEDGKLRLAALPNGYYALELDDFTGSRSFAVVPDPDQRAKNPEMFFAMDSAQSWLARPDAKNSRQPGNAFEVVAEVARRAGLAMVRERLSWGDTEPAPGEFSWKQYKTNADLLSARGIQISGMYHNAPKWAKSGSSHLPGDLLAVYNYAKKAAEAFQGQMTAWEFWNEQDIGFTSEGAWDYAATMKAAYLGFKAADPKLAVAIGGYATNPVPPYADVAMMSGLADYFDIFNIHTYNPLRTFPGVVDSVRAHLGRFGAGERAIWFTENGSQMEGAGRLPSYIPGLKAHSPEQELIVAEYIPKMMINMQMLGVARDFFFVLPPYNEGGGNKDWGLMRRDFTVKTGYAAFATLTDRLGNAVLEGEAALGEGLRGFLYRQPDGSRTLAYWSKSELDTDNPRPNLSVANRFERSFALPKRGEYRGVDLVGTPFVTDGAKVTATRYPAFLDRVEEVKLAVPFTAPKMVWAAEGKADRTVIFRTELSDDFTLFAGKDCVDVKKENARFKLQVWNLSPETKKGYVMAMGGKLNGMPDQFSLPPFGKAEVELEVAPNFGQGFKGTLLIEGLFNGRKTTPLVIPMQSVQAMTDAGRKVPMPQLLDPANWRKNSSGKQEIAYDEAEQAIRFTTRFPEGVDRWVYPEYVLQLPQESLKGALGIGFEVKISPAGAIKQMLVMAVPGKESEGGSARHFNVTAPAETWQERFVSFPAGFDPDKVEQLRIGLNAKRDDITYWVRNVRIFYAP